MNLIADFSDVIGINGQVFLPSSFCRHPSQPVFAEHANGEFGDEMNVRAALDRSQVQPPAQDELLRIIHVEAGVRVEDLGRPLAFYFNTPRLREGHGRFFLRGRRFIQIR